MTQDEQRMLEDLANRIAQTPAPPRDAEAEDFIRRRIGSRPDALYLMTQTVLIQNMALQQAQQQIQDLQQRGQIASGGGSFLGGQPNRGSGYGSQYAAPAAAPAPQYAAPSQATPSPQVAAPSGAPSFLRGAAQTAAGVAAGALAFEGIEHLFSHPGYGGGGGGFFGGGGIGGYGGGPVEETVVNNYYDEPREEGRGNEFADSGRDNDLGPNDDSSAYDDADTSGDSGYDDDSGSGDQFA